MEPMIGLGDRFEDGGGEMATHHGEVVPRDVPGFPSGHKERRSIVSALHGCKVPAQRGGLQRRDVQPPSETPAIPHGVREDELADAGVGEDIGQQRIQLRAGAASADVDVKGPKLSFVLRRVGSRGYVQAGDCPRKVRTRNGESHGHQPSHGVSDQRQRTGGVRPGPVRNVLHARGQGVLGRVGRIPMIAEVDEQAAAQTREASAHPDPVLGRPEKAVQKRN